MSFISKLLNDINMNDISEGFKVLSFGISFLVGIILTIISIVALNTLKCKKGMKITLPISNFLVGTFYGAFLISSSYLSSSGYLEFNNIKGLLENIGKLFTNLYGIIVVVYLVMYVLSIVLTFIVIGIHKDRIYKEISSVAILTNVVRILIGPVPILMYIIPSFRGMVPENGMYVYMGVYFLFSIIPYILSLIGGKVTIKYEPPIVITPDENGMNDFNLDISDGSFIFEGIDGGDKKITEGGERLNTSSEDFFSSMGTMLDEDSEIAFGEDGQIIITGSKDEKDIDKELKEEKEEKVSKYDDGDYCDIEDNDSGKAGCLGPMAESLRSESMGFVFGPDGQLIFIDEDSEEGSKDNNEETKEEKEDEDTREN